MVRSIATRLFLLAALIGSWSRSAIGQSYEYALSQHEYPPGITATDYEFGGFVIGPRDEIGGTYRRRMVGATDAFPLTSVIRTNGAWKTIQSGARSGYRAFGSYSLKPFLDDASLLAWEGNAASMSIYPGALTTRDFAFYSSDGVKTPISLERIKKIVTSQPVLMEADNQKRVLVSGYRRLSKLKKVREPVSLLVSGNKTLRLPAKFLATTLADDGTAAGFRLRKVSRSYVERAFTFNVQTRASEYVSDRLPESFRTLPSRVISVNTSGNLVVEVTTGTTYDAKSYFLVAGSDVTEISRTSGELSRIVPIAGRCGINSSGTVLANSLEGTSTGAVLFDASRGARFLPSLSDQSGLTAGFRQIPYGHCLNERGAIILSGLVMAEPLS